LLALALQTYVVLKASGADGVTCVVDVVRTMGFGNHNAVEIWTVYEAAPVTEFHVSVGWAEVTLEPSAGALSVGGVGVTGVINERVADQPPTSEPLKPRTRQKYCVPRANLDQLGRWYGGPATVVSVTVGANAVDVAIWTS
jgi:hypothetical protein